MYFRRFRNVKCRPSLLLLLSSFWKGSDGVFECVFFFEREIERGGGLCWVVLYVTIFLVLFWGFFFLRERERVVGIVRVVFWLCFFIGNWMGILVLLKLRFFLKPLFSVARFLPSIIIHHQSELL